MRNDSPRGRRLKQELPYPYNQDLSRVLHGLQRRNPITRRSKQANDPVTAAYLAAAVRLIQRHLGPGAIRTRGDPDDPDSVERPLLSFLSQRAVAAEVNHNPPPFHRVGRVSTMRERWRHQSDFIADVLRFGLWARYAQAPRKDEMADAKDEAIGGPDPVRAVHRLGYLAITRLLGTPMFRLGLVAAAESEGDPVIGEALSMRDRVNDPPWKDFYEEFLRTRGLRVRSGITLDECVTLLAALADGLALHALADPAANVVDHDHRCCLLGKAALALLVGCVERADCGEGLSLDQAVRAMACAPAAEYNQQAG